MANLSTQELGTIARKTNVSDSNQTTAYVNAVVDESLKNFIHLSGESNVGPLSLSANLSAKTIYGTNLKIGNNTTIGTYTTAEGTSNTAIANYSHVEGDGSSYSGSYAFYIKTVSTDKLSITLDSDISKISTTDLLIVLNSGASDLRNISSIDTTTNTICLDQIVGSATKANSYVMIMHKPYLGTHAIGDGAHVEGYANFAFEDGHAENIFNAAYGKYSHCHGNANKAGWMSTAFGSGNSAIGKGAIALGGNAATNSKYTVCDTNAVVSADNAFAWSGNGKYEIESAKTGTFNINPKGGVKGFYIGKQSLPDVIHEIVDGKYVDDSGAKIVDVNMSGSELLDTTTAEQFVLKNTSLTKQVYDETTKEYVDVAKTADEMKEEAEHLYAKTDEGDDEYNYYSIVVTLEDGKNSYAWKKITEKAKTTYIKKESDENIGPLHLSGDLSSSNTTYFNDIVGLSAYRYGGKSANGGKLYLPSYMYADDSIAQGVRNECGGYGLYVLSIDKDNKTITLIDGEDVELATKTVTVDGTALTVLDASKNIYSFRFSTNYDCVDSILGKTVDSYGRSVLSVSVLPNITGTLATQIGDIYSNRRDSANGAGTDESPDGIIAFPYLPIENLTGKILISKSVQTIGDYNKAQRSFAVATGEECIVLGAYGHTEGRQTLAGFACHAEGMYTKAIAGYGTGNGAGAASHAEGLYTCAFGNYSHTEGISATAKSSDAYAHVYNGNSTKDYYSHGIGTFNVNPRNGIKGLYVGDNNIVSAMIDAIKTDSTLASALKSALGL